MRWTNYRQSLISSIEPRHIKVFDKKLHLLTDVNATIAHGRTNYLVRLKEGIYDLNINNGTYWVYLEIDTHTAEQSLKISIRDITNYGYGFPSDAERGDLFFNLDNDKSYIKTADGWSENIRINICKIVNRTVEKTYTGLSQVYTRRKKHSTGIIQFDENNRPLKVETPDGFIFVTDADVDLLGLQDLKSSSFENITARHIAGTNIQKHDLLIKTVEYGLIRGTNASSDNPIIAIALNNAADGEKCFVKEQGFITDKQWRWSHPPNTKLFCDSTGRLTTNPDWNANSIQQVAHVVDVDTIYFNPEEKITINSITVQI